LSLFVAVLVSILLAYHAENSLMYSLEQLFIWRIGALKKIIENPTEENLFSASGYLRQVLLDGGDSLLFQVNRNLREEVWFIVCDIAARPNPNHPATKGAIFSMIPDGIAPNPAFPMLPPKRINLDDFLAQEVVHYKGQTAAVRRVIKYVAKCAVMILFVTLS
jgi:hypothetical protein